MGYINSKGEEIISPDFEAMGQANLRRYHDKFIIGLKDSIHYVFDYSGKEIAVCIMKQLQNLMKVIHLFLYQSITNGEL